MKARANKYTETITIRLSSAHMNWIKRVARLSNINESDVIRSAIDAAFKNRNAKLNAK